MPAQTSGCTSFPNLPPGPGWDFSAQWGNALCISREELQRISHFADRALLHLKDARISLFLHWSSPKWLGEETAMEEMLTTRLAALMQMSKAARSGWHESFQWKIVAINLCKGRWGLMHEDSLKQLEMCTVACLNDSHLPSDTHTFYCACQSAQAQKRGKKLGCFFFPSLLLLQPFWAFVRQVTSLLPLTHLLRCLSC